MADIVRRNTWFDLNTATQTLIASGRTGWRIAIYSITAQGHADGQVVQIQGSVDGQAFTNRHWPIKCGDGAGAGESLGGQTPIVVLPAGEGAYLNTEQAVRVSGNVVWDYVRADLAD